MFSHRPRTAATLTAAALAGALVLTGCGSDDKNGGKEQAKNGSSDTRKITDANGKSVTVPADPMKVVTLSEPTLDAALALGIEPIGATAGRGQKGVSTYLADKAAKAEVVASIAEPDLEKLATLQPDLILLDETTGSKRFLDKLGEIAPTVVTAKLNEDWKKAFSATADALNKKSDADKLLSEFDADLAKTKGELGKNAAAVSSVIRWQNGAPSVVGKGKGHVGSTLSALGLTRPKDQQGESIGHSEPVSLEKLDTIDGDWLFFGALGDKAASEKAYAEAKKVPNFTKLKAEKAGHVVVIEGSAWNSAGGFLAARTVLADVTEALVG
ncbi:ABC transporter substrate-binding protein [Streptomyces sp. YC504]|uniref:ABC transporter substrate-binding protein n=1 Tax=Streptomyces mesophilus TaxID=1775132 RepID=A0A6G4XFV9_9ACTN|nr:ABC transporter substrate-binding protein [Streptomyces mesophilus]NGO76429.1 ABC transporter substrate-binding protein [Streptomyces mesophilus]